jgi:hypothetical protein
VFPCVRAALSFAIPLSPASEHATSSKLPPGPLTVGPSKATTRSVFVNVAAAPFKRNPRTWFTKKAKQLEDATNDGLGPNALAFELKVRGIE